MQSSESFYHFVKNQNLAFKTLNTDIVCDICIIGGGLTGLLTALNLAKSTEYNIVLIEAGKIANQASGINGGQVCNSYQCGMDYLEKKVGSDKAKVLWNLTIEAVATIKKNINEYNISCNFKPGLGVAAYKASHIKRIEQEFYLIQNKYNYPNLTLYSKQDTAKFINSKQYHGLLYDSGAGHLNPLNYTLGIANAISQYPNIHIYEDTRAISLEQLPNNIHSIKVANGYTVQCHKVILNANINNQQLIKGLNGLAVPVTTFIVATKQLDEKIAKSLITNDMAIYDTRTCMDFYRLTEDNRLLFGGGDSFGINYDPQKIFNILKNSIIKIFPQLTGVEIEYFWSGVESLSLNLAPIIGKAENTEIYYAYGFSGHGFSLAHLASKVISDAIKNDDYFLQIFNQIIPFRLPNIKFIQQIASACGILYYKALDKFF